MSMIIFMDLTQSSGPVVAVPQKLVAVVVVVLLLLLALQGLRGRGV